MSIKIDPTQNFVELNGKPMNCLQQNNDENYIFLYKLDSYDEKDIDLLTVFNDNHTVKNAKIMMIDRYSQKEYLKEYIDGIESSTKNTITSIFVKCDDQITQENNVEKICLMIYKKYLESYIIMRSNKFVNEDFVYDIYLIFGNNLYNEIYDKMKLYFGNLIKNSNIKFHMINVVPPTNYYTSGCIIS
jgi:hypothetical protein